MSRIDIEQLKQSIDMVELVGIWVDLKRAGSVHNGLCPFHPDKDTPSLTVYDTSSYCFGCGIYLDAIDWVMLQCELDFRNAVEWLCTRAQDFPMQPRKESSPPVPLKPISMDIIQLWHKYALRNAEVMGYFKGRCLSEETIFQYMLGWTGHNYVIPIWEGEPRYSLVYGVKFRRCGKGKPKYWGLEGRNQPRLFNSYVLYQTNEVIVLLGEFDAILATQLGVTAVSPTAGQNAWLPEWTSLLKNIEKKYIVPDRGELAAGYRIAAEIKGEVREFPPEVKDFTEFVQAGYDAEAFRSILAVKNPTHSPRKVIPCWEEK